MPEVSTKVYLCQGHDGCAPRPFAENGPNLFAEGFPSSVVGTGRPTVLVGEGGRL